MALIGIPENVTATLLSDNVSAQITFSVGTTETGSPKSGTATIKITDNYGNSYPQTGTGTIVRGLRPGSAYQFTVTFIYSPALIEAATSNLIQTPGSAPVGNENLEPPSVTIVGAYGQTLDQPPFFQVQVTAAEGTSANDYQLIPAVNQLELEQLEAKDGNFDQVAIDPGSYQFKGQAHNKQSDGSYLWSDWSVNVSQNSPPNYTSLLEFLQVSAQLGAAGITFPNVDVGNLMRQKGQQSLAKLMGLSA